MPHRSEGTAKVRQLTKRGIAHTESGPQKGDPAFGPFAPAVPGPAEDDEDDGVDDEAEGGQEGELDVRRISTCTTGTGQVRRTVA